MSSDKVIRITCDPEKQQDRVPLAELEDFQGDLKALSDAAEAELAANLVDLGYSYPTCVWHGHKAILDGHQRNKVLRRLLADGYVLVDVDDEPTESVPVTWVMADSEQQARKKVLAAVSQYGKLSDVGLRDFLGAADLEWPEVKPWVDLPDFDTEAFVGAFWDVEGALPDLPSGDRQPFQQMTFTLHDEQAECVKDAVNLARRAGNGFEDSPNENGNGNALALICGEYLATHG